MSEAKFRVTRSILAGGRIWSEGLYPTPEISKVEALLRVAKYEESQKLAVNERTVLRVGKGETKVDNAPKSSESNENSAINVNVPDSNEGSEISDNKANKELDNENDYLTAEQFDALTATEQKKYVTNLSNDESLTDDAYYGLLSDYQSVATAKSVVELIATELASYEEQ